MTPYPLLLTPLLFEKVWGGRRLQRLGKSLPPTKLIGESWELADLSSTSASGAGGAPARSAISNGPLAGRTLHDALDLWGDHLLPRAALTPAGNFPLLIKFLDASENLSVQVHPSPAYAQTHPDAHLKTECWHILDAAPNSVIYKGIKPGISRERFAELARAGGRAGAEGGAIVDALIAIPARPGECHNLPSGTVHALGAGVLVAEVQTPSDTTFRLYDWGRTGRELHIDQALECADLNPPPSPIPLATDPSAVVTTDFFTIKHYRIDHDGIPAAVESGRAFTILSGTLELTGPKLPSGPYLAPAGTTGFLPAKTDPSTLLRAASPHPVDALFITIAVSMKRLIATA